MASTTIEALPLTSLPITNPASATIGVGSSIEQLAKSMEDMNLQTEEIKILETQVNVLQDQIKRAESDHSIKM